MEIQILRFSSEGRISTCKTLGKVPSISTLFPLLALDQLMCSIMAGGISCEFRFFFPPCKVVGRVEDESLDQTSGNLQTVMEKDKGFDAQKYLL